jgi:hypothetical protein
MENKSFIIKNISKDRFSPFNATEEELIAFSLDENSLLNEKTTINELNARELVISFYNKREKFRQNSRLGHIIMKENNLSKDDLIRALVYHEQNEVPLGEAFIKLGICTQEQVNKALEIQMQIRNYIL